jgi:hypothetical protein
MHNLAAHGVSRVTIKTVLDKVSEAQATLHLQTYSNRSRQRHQLRIAAQQPLYVDTIGQT